MEHGDEFWQHECSLTELNESLKKLKRFDEADEVLLITSQNKCYFIALAKY